MLDRIATFHGRFFGAVQSSLEDWFLGLSARLVFAAVLFVYFFNSALTKIGDGIFGFLSIADNAYFQILPTVVERYGFDASQIPFFPYKIIVFAGTYAEFLLPVLVIVGLFTRIAALGMIGFVVVQSYVDIAFHGADETTVGAWFDRLPDATILDQRALWVFLLAYLVIRGPGLMSLDTVLGRHAPEFLGHAWQRDRVPSWFAPTSERGLRS
ncbi:MAG: DoxX family protein [Alphaproteobacteria bacterium]|nr:DoxX family protein [Alphaproteobacteria bacterium]